MMALDPIVTTGVAQHNGNFMLLDGVTATANSTWVKVKGYNKFDFFVDGIVSGDVVTVYVFIDDGTGEPAAATHKEAISPTFTADGPYEMTYRPDYIKARLTATAGGGTVDVVCKAGAE